MSIKEVAIIGRGPSMEECKLVNCEKWFSQSTYNAMIDNEIKINKNDKAFRLHIDEVKHKPNHFGRTLAFQYIPVDILRRVFGDLFHSSAAWMLGTAVIVGYKKIHLIGVDLLNRAERGIQRDGLFRLIGMAEIMGIDMMITIRSGMYLHPQLYGLQDFIDVLDKDVVNVKGDKHETL